VISLCRDITPARPERDKRRTRAGALGKVTIAGVKRYICMDRDSELELVARVRAGDAGAFDAIHAEFNGRLFNFLARLSRRREVAEDLLDETWMRFVDRAHRLNPDTRLAPFLFTVARNLYVSYCRARMLEDAQSADAIGLWPLGSPAPSPFESTVANETGRRLDEAIAALPAAHREALLLVAVEGMKPAEAAAVCGITAEAMRQRLSRARAAIARHLDEGDSISLATLKAVTT
jgi:RNA polymerase sigma-70 factor (ECF subfamily)